MALGRTTLADPPEPQNPDRPDADRADRIRHQATDPIAAYQMVSLLRGVVERGTGSRAGTGLNRPIAGKTGTTDDYKDNWFVGFTPDIAIAVWMGYDDPRSLGNGETGGGNAFNLIVDKRSSDELAVNGTLVAGYEFGSLRADDVWIRTEIEGGRRQIIGGSLGETTARFKDGAAFTLLPDARSDGWIGWLRLVGGQQGFALAGEVGAEEQYGNLALNARVSLRIGF